MAHSTPNTSRLDDDPHSALAQEPMPSRKGSRKRDLRQLGFPSERPRRSIRLAWAAEALNCTMGVVPVVLPAQSASVQGVSPARSGPSGSKR